MGQISKSFRLIFFLWNLLYFAIGVVMFSFGVYVIVHLNEYGFFTESLYIAGAVIFIIVGVVKMAVAVVGIIGMFGKWRLVLGVYTTVVIFLMVMTFIAAIYGFLRRVDAYDETNQRLTRAYSNCAEYNNDIDTVQDEFNCCGVNAESMLDFNNTDAMRFENCSTNILQNCVTTRNTSEPNVERYGCLVYLTQEIQKDLYDLGAIGMGFGTFELASLLIAMQNLEGL